MTTTLAILLLLLASWCFVHAVTKQGVFESKAQASRAKRLFVSFQTEPLFRLDP